MYLHTRLRFLSATVTRISATLLFSFQHIFSVVKGAAFSGALGAALADLLSGYTIWIVPTFISKFLTVAVCCLIAKKIFKRSLAGYAVGGVVGMLVHIGAYSLSWYLLYGTAAMLSALPTLAIQTVVGYAGSAVFILVLRKSKADKKLQEMAGFNPQKISEKEIYNNEKD